METKVLIVFFITQSRNQYLKNKKIPYLSLIIFINIDYSELFFVMVPYDFRNIIRLY